MNDYFYYENHFCVLLHVNAFILNAFFFVPEQSFMTQTSTDSVIHIHQISYYPVSEVEQVGGGHK